MKIVFYDIKESEYIYLNENLDDDIQAFFESSRLTDKTIIKDNYKNCDAISTFVSSEINENVLKKFPDLKFIFLRCTGYSNCDLEYCKKKSIRVFNVSSYGTTSVAEFVFALILSISKKLNLADRELIGSEIDNRTLVGVELENKTLGIIGMGSIGQKTAKIASGFNLKVLCYDTDKKEGYNYVELGELLKNSDFISISCPLTPETKNLINKDTISEMKSSAFIINTARGEIINSKDLYSALVEGKIKGAALDVIECEQSLCELFATCKSKSYLEENCAKKYLYIKKLFALPNVIITPHIAYNTVEANKRIMENTILNIKSSSNVNSDTKNLVF